MSELVEISLTTDRFESEILAEAVKAEGYNVQVLHDDELGTGSGSLARPSYLLAHAADVDAIRRVLARSTES